MIIEHILTPERTACNVATSSKKRTFEFIADRLGQSQPASPCINADNLLEHLNARERLGSTGIGKGIAIPHCRCSDITETIGLLIKLKKPVDFDAPDDQPVDILFVMVVPQDANDQHLQILSSLAELFHQAEFRNQLRKAQTNDELYMAALNYEKSTQK
ncbi:Nitrogen regulatory protein [BD1-7 clade bacterium]|uniref:Nitrogen regulatory protein n=1 Tax=BD1-7 clade bacterium TaxID=2029982 RepID=A0A5S9N0H7_9GAMM|nr:Nitrogen regulatory protein [BD1-7 clade bacterium]